MTSPTISRGRLAVVVGKTLLVGRLLVYFASIRSLFSFTLLTYKIIIKMIVQWLSTMFVHFWKQAPNLAHW